MKKQLTYQQLHDELKRASVITMGCNVFARGIDRKMIYERHSVQYLLKTRYKFSYSIIGAITSSSQPFDHATVLFAVNKVEAELCKYNDRVDNIAKWTCILNDIEDLHKTDNIYQWLIAQREKVYFDEKEIINEILKQLGYGE